MSRSNNHTRNDGSHGIRMPGVLLDSIRDKDEKGDYEKDSRFYTGKKRKGPIQSRKEKRQQERQAKKQKRHPTTTKKPQNQPAKIPNKQVSKQRPKSTETAPETKSASSEDPLAALKKLKGNKSVGELRVVKEDELDDDSLSDFDDLEGDLDESEGLEDLEDLEDGLEGLEFEGFDAEETEDHDDPMAALRALKVNRKEGGFRVVKEDELDDDSVDSESNELDDDEEVEDPLEALKRLKKGKNSLEVRIVKEEDLEDELSDDLSEELEEEDPFDKLKAKKQKKKESKKETKKESKKAESTKSHEIPPDIREQMRRDEEEMAFYAKKLGLKNGKNAKLSKNGDDDMIGGLLDGLDLDFSEPEQSSEEELQEEEGDEEEGVEENENAEENGNYGSDDSISDGDFDSGLESELEELYGTSRHANGDDEDDYEESTVPVKENPFVAPSQGDEEPSRYIPPALRRKMALESGTVSAEVLALQRSIKGSVNKLSEGNINSIVNDINTLYMNNPRHIVNETLTNTIIESIVLQGRLIETFVYLQSCLVTAIYRLQGTEFGAHFIQTLIEKFDQSYQNPNATKETSNLISLLSTIYTFQLVSSKLIYDIIKLLLNEFNEQNAEILLRLIRNSGNQIRSDDPTALKEIVLLSNLKISSMKNPNPRTQFLVETINSLKNNKMRAENEFTQELAVRLKKFLGNLGNKLSDPIQVGLDDIRNVETKGKWWLVGSAWKDSEESSSYDTKAMNDILDTAEPNWMQIAKEQRMNTDIRRAIFITIMSSEDYIDAVTKLDKLQLKKAQEREIPRILIHCVGMEASWNPFYGLLAHKLSESHSYRKTFQFMFWDILKEFDNGNGDSDDEDDFRGFDNDQDEDTKLKRIYNLGRFFGFMMAEGSLPLHSLKNVNFLVATNDAKLLLEIILVTFLDQIAKKSQISTMGTGFGGKIKTEDLRFSDQLLAERVLKSKDQTALLRGLQYFVQEKTLKSSFVNGKRQRKRVEWGSNALFDIIDELLLNSQD